MISTAYRGLLVESDPSPYVHATQEQPAGGGCCEAFEIWGVDDADELAEWVYDICPAASHRIRSSEFLPGCMSRLLADRWEEGILEALDLELYG